MNMCSSLADRSRRVARSLALCALLTLVGSAAQAQDRNVAGASEAFSKAQQAELRGDFQEAASMYALADEMAPAAEALRGAARTAQQAGLNATAATHAATLLSREPDTSSRILAEGILRDTAGQLTKLHVSCNAPCKVLIDSRMTASRLSRDHLLYARPGDRFVSASFDSGNAPAQSRALTAGGSEELSFNQPVSAPVAAVAVDTSTSTRREDSHGISPWYFYSAGVLTVVAGGLTVWRGLEVNSKHDKYDRGAPDAQSDFDEGRKLEKQTNALIGVTAGFALATATLAFFTDFKRSERNERQAARARALTVNATGHGAVLGWAGSF